MISVYIFLIFLIPSISGACTKAKLERKFVSVLFRHGDRTPACFSLGYQFAEAAGQLSQMGMQREYELGQHIREEYRDILNETYNSGMVLTRSTDFDRTKMSLQLVMAGMFPPTKRQQWNSNIMWQPVITNYVPSAHDFMLTTNSCAKYTTELKNVMALPEVTRKIAKYNDLMANLTALLGQPMRSLLFLTCLYTDLAAIQAMGLQLPEWSLDLFPKGRLLNATILTYDILSYNQKLNKLNGGLVLKNFTDTAISIMAGDWNPNTKMLLLSAHDINIAALLIALKIYDCFEPQYSSAVFLELLKDNYQYYVRVYYYMGIPETRRLLPIPNCEDPCPFSDFMDLYGSVLPTKQEMCS